MKTILFIIALLQPESVDKYEYAYKHHVNKQHHSALNFINAEMRSNPTGKALALKLRIMTELDMINHVDAHKMYQQARMLDETIPPKSCVRYLQECDDYPDYRYIKIAHKHDITLNL